MHNDRIWELMARKIAGEASDLELLELQELQKHNPQSHFAMQTITDLWRPTQKATDNQSITEEAYLCHLNRMKDAGLQIQSAEATITYESVPTAPKVVFLRKKWLVAAAAVLIVLVSATLLWSDRFFGNTSLVHKPEHKTPISEVSTKYGSKTRILLPDGTQVWLNAGSKLNYGNDFGQFNREVQLIGEGFFDVVKNPQKPFIIHTSSIDVKVLGTMFNVKSYPGDKTTETSLIHGSVEVVVRKRPNEKYILKPNEKIVVLNEEEEIKPKAARKPQQVIEPIIAIRKLTYKENDSISVETAWAFNKLSFEDETFSEVARKMERWYDVKFEFRNKQLEDIRLKGSFINESLPQAMEALQYTNRFRYEIEGKNVTIF